MLWRVSRSRTSTLSGRDVDRSRSRVWPRCHRASPKAAASCALSNTPVRAADSSSTRPRAHCCSSEGRDASSPATRQVDFSTTDVRVSSRGSATWRRHLTSPSIATQVRDPTSAWLQQHPRDSSRHAKLGSVPVHLDRSARHSAARSAGGVTFVMAIMKEIGATQPSHGPFQAGALSETAIWIFSSLRNIFGKINEIAHPRAIVDSFPEQFLP